MEPLVSVCIPAYNNAEYIKDTIDSILNRESSFIIMIRILECQETGTAVFPCAPGNMQSLSVQMIFYHRMH